MFICNKCGLCCKNINRIPDLKEFDSGNGVCIHLGEDNLCNIYLSRPDICNVDKMFDKIFKYYMTRSEYDYLNSEGCKALQRGNEEMKL